LPCSWRITALSAPVLTQRISLYVSFCSSPLPCAASKREPLYRYLNYKKDKYKIKPTKGESLFELRKRIEPFIKEIIRENSGKTALVIAHNGPLRIIIGILNNYNGKKIASLHLKPASLTIIKIAE